MATLETHLAADQAIPVRGRDTSPTHYVPILDGVRAFSISLVLVSHLVIYNQPNHRLYEWGLVCGWVGVSVFFVLSGYLITSVLLREESSKGSIDLRGFYVRRVLRIFPAAYFFLGIILVLWLVDRIEMPVHSFWASVLYVRNYIGRGHETGHLWSLAIEEHFYLLWPALLILIPGKFRIKTVLTIIGLTCAWRTILVIVSNIEIGPLQHRTDLRVDTILIGGVLALAMSQFASGQPQFRLFNRWYFGVFSLAGLLLWNHYGDSLPYYGALDTTIVAILICMSLAWLMENQVSTVGRWMQFRPFVFVGKLSYSIYLWQQLFFGPQSEKLGFVRVFPWNLLLTLAAASISYFLVEKPFLALKERLRVPETA